MIQQLFVVLICCLFLRVLIFAKGITTETLATLWSLSTALGVV